MKYFGMKEVREAKAHSLAGGQALHVHEPGGMKKSFPKAPECFKRARLWGHLMDQDMTRLDETARRFGVRRVSIQKAGEPDQHVDLCGEPLMRAIEEAER